MGELADLCMAASHNDLTTAQAWVGIIAYSFQIYFDFSGYSDMAIGIGRTLGFEFRENFNYPYAARSYKLLATMAHFVVVVVPRLSLYPSRRKSGCSVEGLQKPSTCSLRSGMARVGTLLFGACFMVFSIIERSVPMQKLLKSTLFPGRCYTLITVMVAWVFFRLETLPEALSYLSIMFLELTLRGLTSLFDWSAVLTTLSMCIFYGAFAVDLCKSSS